MQLLSLTYIAVVCIRRAGERARDRTARYSLTSLRDETSLALAWHRVALARRSARLASPRSASARPAAGSVVARRRAALGSTALSLIMSKRKRDSLDSGDESLEEGELEEEPVEASLVGSQVIIAARP
eukprot:6191907-Pleurochrysis_carterae.AAC.2